MSFRLRTVLIVWIWSLISLAGGGCATSARRIDANQPLFATLSKADQELVREGIIRPGFDQDVVRLALGEPDKKLHLETGGSEEVWLYNNYKYSGKARQFIDEGSGYEHPDFVPWPGVLHVKFNQGIVSVATVYWK